MRLLLAALSLFRKPALRHQPQPRDLRSSISGSAEPHVLSIDGRIRGRRGCQLFIGLTVSASLQGSHDLAECPCRLDHAALVVVPFGGLRTGVLEGGGGDAHLAGADGDGEDEAVAEGVGVDGDAEPRRVMSATVVPT